MARKAKGVTLTFPPGAVDDAAEEQSEELTAEVLEAAQRLDPGGKAVRWYLSREGDEDDERNGHVAQLRTVELDEEHIRKHYGGGRYRLKGKGPDGRYVPSASFPLKIAGGPPDSEHKNGSSTDSILREWRERDDRDRRARGEDLRNWATLFATPLATIVAAFLSRPQPQQTDIAALITALKPRESSLGELTQAAQIFADRSGGNADERNAFILKLLDRLQELPEGGGGGGGKRQWWQDLLAEAGPVVREVVGAVQSRRPASAQPSTLPPRPVPGSAPQALPVSQASPPETPPPPAAASPPAQPIASAAPLSGSSSPHFAGTESVDAMWSLIEPWLRKKLLELAESAANDMDVTLAAEHLLASVPRAYQVVATPEKLKEWVSHPQWWQITVNFEGTVAPHYEWAVKFREALLEELESILGDSEGSEP